MKSFFPIMGFAISLLLASCGETISSSSDIEDKTLSSSEIVDPVPSPSTSEGTKKEVLPFKDAVALLLGIEQNEKDISSQTRVTRKGRDDFEKIDTNTLTLYSDSTSQSEGTITGTNEAPVSYKSRVEFANERIRGTDGNVYDMARRYEVKDYDQSNPKAPIDTAYKLYVLPNQDSAGGFPADSYILLEEKALKSTLCLTRESAEFIASMAASPYIPQTGVTGFTVSKSGDKFVYEASASYSVTEEYIRSEHRYHCSFVLDETKTHLLNFVNELETKDVNVNDPTDFSISFSDLSGTLKYETKTAAPASALRTSDYFLQTVNNVDLLDTERKVVNPQDIKLGASTFLFARPNTYVPSSACDIDEFTLSPLKSSNPAVVSFETSGQKNFFLPKGFGQATLTFGYYGLGQDGIYDVQEIAIDVTVSSAPIDSLTLSSVFSPDVTDGTLLIGKTYRQTMSKSPSYGVGTIEVVSSDPAICHVSYAKGVITFTPLKPGSFTLDIAVKENPSAKATETLQVKDPVSPDALPSLLASGKWTYRDVFGWSVEMTFDKTGAGTWKTFGKNNAPMSNGTFSWILSLKGSLNLKDFKGATQEDQGDAAFLFERYGENSGIVTVSADRTAISFYSETHTKTYYLNLAA